MMLRIVLGLVLSSIALSTSTDIACEDKSTTACQRLATFMPDICENNCTASLCPKICGKCPLTCFSCGNITDPSQCQVTSRCNDTTMLCITSQTLDGNLQRTFMQGCVDPQICSTLYGTVSNRTAINLKRDVNLLGGCCGSDFCNKYTEPEKAPTVQTPNTVAAVSSSQQFSQNCNQLDETVCKLLVSAVGCTDTCVSKICPQTCGHCNRKCFVCAETDHPGNCNQRITCNGSTEVCSAAPKSGGYELTCLDRQICKDTITKVGRGGTCCETDYCNGYFQPTNNLTTSHAPITTQMTNHHVNTTRQPTLSGHTSPSKLGLPTDCTPKMWSKGDHTECPVHFYRHGTSCYHAGSDYKTQSEAVAECHSMCTRLAIISNERENQLLTRMLTSLSSYHRHEAKFYWIDGFLEHTHWRWNSTSTSFHHYSNWKPGTPDHSNKDGEHCLEFGKGEDAHRSQPHPHGYYWNDRSCLHKYPALCEYPLTRMA